jgi:hypothetical protein
MINGISKQKEDESEHVASLLPPPPLMCACFFLISSVRSARNGKMKKTGEMRTEQILFKNDFQNEATLVMENEKANTWRACHSRHR